MANLYEDYYRRYRVDRVPNDIGSPVCGNLDQINRIVDLIKKVDIPTLQKIITIPDLSEMPEHIHQIFYQIYL